MPSNYESITADNIRDRGEKFDEFGKFLAEYLYSDDTHFIYELLQNAQDALKRRSVAELNNSFPRSVYFSLYPDRLVLRHYGQTFNENDVKGISDIFQGTKSLDENQIGKFGIGFKSVYAFTESPEIHSGDEHFVIDRYIRPRSTTSVDLQVGETLFIFPFNHKEKTESQTFESIRNRLADLGLRTLLFLDEIDQIVWDLSGKRSGAYIRDKQQFQNGICRVTLLGEEEQNKYEENWLIFQQSTNSSGSNIEIAFNLVQDEKTKKDIINPIDQSYLYAYFATKIETRLRFLIQGPYRTTPSRDNFLESDEFNKFLISKTAKLLIQSLETLKSMELLNAETFESMPLKREHFASGSFFQPVYDEFRQAMLTLDLLPTVDGDFAKAEEVKLARGTELIQLLPIESLKALFGFSKEYRWLSDDITRDKTRDLREYILSELKIEEIEPEKFARQITQEFLKSQTDEWFIKFYEFLDGQNALWRPKSSYLREGVLRAKPFIRTEDSKLMAPFDITGNPLVFLPGSDETDFPVVKKSIIKNQSALKFLTDLGLHEPDLVDEILKFVLPKYTKEKINVADEVHLNDIKKIMSSLESATGTKKERLLIQLTGAHFLRATNPGNALRTYKKPAEIYIDDDGLRCYFDGNSDVWFYDAIYIRFKKLLEDLGVNHHIRMWNSGGRCKYKPLQDVSGWHVRGVEGFDPDWEVDGLLFAIQNPNRDRTRYIWENILRPNKHLVYGTLETSTRQDFSSPNKTNNSSKAGDIVRRGRWLPDKDGIFHIPAEMSLDDLPEDFFKDEELANKLGMKAVTLRAFAIERGVDENALNLAIEWIKSDPDSFNSLASKTLERPVKDRSSESFNFVSSLQSTFAKPSDELTETDEVAPDSQAATVQDTERRRRKVQEDILVSLLNEIEKDQRYRRIPSIVWEKKDNRVRSFLLEQYHGQCQICSSTFKKRNGSPYFEGLSLVSRINAPWVDRSGDVLCLCPTCCAKFQHGQVLIEDVVNQILQCKMNKEGGSGHPGIIVELCGEQVEIHFTERHMIDLQEMINVSMQNSIDNIGDS
jgi:hypothetical protein